ncbi:MAG: hypothetical protein QM278_11485 [Pseudomonadota bacterium]|nr:hypothetical protein [Pseudomonadota bacterium]
MADAGTTGIGLTVVFDYSGTLSPDAVAFARSDNLVEELRRSGLAEFGVADPETFWDRFVNPTWEEGSRGSIGYRRLLTREIGAAWRAEGKEAALPALERAASAFVTRYLACSRIDPPWHPLLRSLYDHPLAVVVVATDHYAEATAAIGEHFAHLGMEAAPLAAADAGCRLLVANSADLGWRKDEEEFWLAVREALKGRIAGPVMLVDDFGGNEPSGDRYGRRDKVAARRRRTEALLAEVFAGDPVEICPFLPPAGAVAEEGTRRLIEAIAARITARMAALTRATANGRPR